MEAGSVVATDGDDRPSRKASRYGDDAHAWALELEAFPRGGRFDDLDLVNLADVANRDDEALESDLSRVLQHLLQWDRQSERRSRSWARTIKAHRRTVVRRLISSPSLKSRLGEALAVSDERGRAEALQETDLPDAILPIVNPYSWDEAMTRPVEWPEP